MKVVIKFEKEVENCRECPFCNYDSDEQFSWHYCKVGESHFHNLPFEGIDKYCPYLKKEREEN